MSVPVREDGQLNGVTLRGGQLRQVAPRLPDLHPQVAAGSHKGGALGLYDYRADVINQDSGASHAVAWL